jgi:putative transposase
MSKAPEEWAWQRGVKLDFIRPKKPSENGHIESSRALPQAVALQLHREASERRKLDNRGPHATFALTPHEDLRNQDRVAPFKRCMAA